MLGSQRFVALHEKAKKGWGRRLYKTALQEHETLTEALERAYEEYGRQLGLPEGG